MSKLIHSANRGLASGADGPVCAQPDRTSAACNHARAPFCEEPECVERRLRQVDRLVRSCAARRLAAALADLTEAAGELRDLLATHGPDHNCELCRYVRRDPAFRPEWFWEDALVLCANVEAGAGRIADNLPAALEAGR